ncbi:cellulose biosynthesis protein BcsN [Rhizobium sp. LjRoot30]|uniref:cellulose biosynthesis protein BcsN n=1 Tax=Rhizobium sp. LjRoot30 TaxID=3342320 RepID=UPI003ED0A8C2
MNFVRLAIAAGLTALLAGCTSVQDPFLTGATATSVAGPSVSNAVSAEFATASLPLEAGRVVGVQQDVRSDGLSQAILYENATSLPGENRVSVDFGAPGSSSRYLRAPTSATVRAELRSVLPGIRMQISNVPGNNAQGVFGYATGSTGRGACLYAWQLAKGGLGEGYAAQVRLRYCHPTLPAESLVGLMQQLRLRPVSKETLATFRFANSAVRPAAALEETRVSTLSTDVEEQPVRRRSRQTTDTETASATDGVAVPLPDSTARASSADTATADSRKVTPTDVSVAVPLPQ